MYNYYTISILSKKIQFVDGSQEISSKLWSMFHKIQKLSQSILKLEELHKYDPNNHQLKFGQKIMCVSAVTE